jgi:hypothetical protein
MCLDAELAHEGMHRVLARAEPGATNVNTVAGAFDRPNASTDAIARFEHTYFATSARDLARRTESCIAGSDHTNVALDSIGHDDIVARPLIFRLRSHRARDFRPERRYTCMAVLLLEAIALTAVVLAFRLAAMVVTMHRAAPQGPPSAVPDDEGGADATMARVLAEVEHLAALRDRGALTDKEFAAQKTKLLRDHA